jgi:hypothetical protein
VLRGATGTGGAARHRPAVCVQKRGERVKDPWHKMMTYLFVGHRQSLVGLTGFEPATPLIQGLLATGAGGGLSSGW